MNVLTRPCCSEFVRRSTSESTRHAGMCGVSSPESFFDEAVIDVDGVIVGTVIWSAATCRRFASGDKPSNGLFILEFM